MAIVSVGTSLMGTGEHENQSWGLGLARQVVVPAGISVG